MTHHVQRQGAHQLAVFALCSTLFASRVHRACLMNLSQANIVCRRCFYTKHASDNLSKAYEVGQGWHHT